MSQTSVAREANHQNIIETPDLTKDQIELIKRTVAKGATDDEVQMFLHVCNKYGLDPFRGEIVFQKLQGRATFITTRDGYLKIAMQDPEYRGIMSAVVREGDEFEFIPSEFTVRHKHGKTRGKILGAWAIAYHARRNPVVCWVDFNEYYKPASPTWKQYPSAMVQKVAEVFVLKRQFNISGLVTREEIGLEAAELAEQQQPGAGVASVSEPTTAPVEAIVEPEEATKTEFLIVEINDEIIKAVDTEKNEVIELSREQFDGIMFPGITVEKHGERYVPQTVLNVPGVVGEVRNTPKTTWVSFKPNGADISVPVALPAGELAETGQKISISGKFQEISGKRVIIAESIETIE